jgi:uncharacterized protein (DUF1684 family)
MPRFPRGPDRELFGVTDRGQKLDLGLAEPDAAGQSAPSCVPRDPNFAQRFLPAAGVFPADTTQVYRVFSNRLDASRRYMTERTIRDQTVARGWLTKGDGPDLVVVCAPQQRSRTLRDPGAYGGKLRRKPMRCALTLPWFLSVLVGAGAAAVMAAPTGNYAAEIAAWRKAADDGLRADLGWLTIAGRWELKRGENTIGSAPGNDIVLPKVLAPAKVGVLRVGADGVRLILQSNLNMWVEPEPGTCGPQFEERVLKTRGDDVEWVSSGRLSLYVVTLDDGRSIMRIADRESQQRRQFTGRIWHEPNSEMLRPARFVPYPAGTRIPVANVRGEISEEDAAGFVEFAIAGRTLRLDAFGENDGSLFLLLRDETSGATTYPGGRFLRADKPIDGKTLLDFNKAYNPPCAFSAYTTCPLPPPQNWLKVRIEAGEKYVQSKN